MAIDSQSDMLNRSPETGRKKRQSHPRMIVFLVCLVISLLMWLFIELMKDYTDEVRYKVSFINAPRDLILTDSGENVVTVGMKAQGFELLVAKYAPKLRQLTIDLSTLKIRPSNGGYAAYLPAEKIMDQLGNQIRFDKEIAYLKPDTLFFRFSEVYRKQVPVKLNVNYSLNSQYDLTDSVTFKPAMVTVSSIKDIIDTLRVVRTQMLNLPQLDSSLSVKVALFKGKQAGLLKYSHDSVTVNFNIEKVTESTYVVPLTATGNGESIKVFPDKVNIICRVPLSVYPHIEASDFMAEVKLQPSLIKEKRLKVNLTKVPDKVKVLKIVPPDVEFIVIAK